MATLEPKSKPFFVWITRVHDVFCFWTATLFLVLVPAVQGQGNGAAPALEVTAVAGGGAWLPCNITLSGDSDRPVALVLWYRDNSTTPVYTVDARWGGLHQGARHFPGEDDLAARLSFDASRQPALLRLSRVETGDAGVYRCRVDYRQARTEVTLLVLRVIVPPREIIVLDEHGQRQIGSLGPYNEGATMLLACEVEGGDPPPKALWFRNGELVDASFSVLRQQGVVRNELRLGPLQRQDLQSELECSASNNNLTEPLTSRLTIELNLKPAEVEVTLPALSQPLSGGAALVAGEVVEARCLVKGARPLAQVAWFKSGHRLQPDRLLSREPGSTLSAVSFAVRAQDNGGNLTCRADNPDLPGSELSSTVALDVHYAPQMSLVATNLRPRVGDNVTLRCEWKANPGVTDVLWRHDGQLLSWRGAVVAMGPVTRAHEGLYECLASNEHGEGFSNQLHLSVLYAPECAEGGTAEYAAAPELRVACEVRANPDDELRFEWLANTTRRVGRIDSLAVNGTRALARAVASRELEYGLLLCWASNSVGKQPEPCVFRIVQPAPPGSPHNCTVTRQSQDDVVVRCLPGVTGGLPVTFFAELHRAGPASSILLLPLRRNTSDTRWPQFVFAGIPQTGPLLVRVYAANAQGRSGTAEVRFLEDPRQLHDTQGSAGLDTSTARLTRNLLGFLTAVVVALTCAIVCLIVTKHRKHSRKRKGSKGIVKLKKCSQEETFHDCASSGIVCLSPDLITTKYCMSDNPDTEAPSPLMHDKMAAETALDARYMSKDSLHPVASLQLTTFVGSCCTKVRRPLPGSPAFSGSLSSSSFRRHHEHPSARNQAPYTIRVMHTDQEHERCETLA
ncbi:neural cell adhesion molecule 2-like [Amblyomma americanum]